jgi:hypothetical protein
MADEIRDDYRRTLGVIEAITVVTQQCPSGAVRACAERALDTIRTEGSSAVREQAWFVLTAIRGWRGDRAQQVAASLSHFLEPSHGGDGEG